MRWAVLILGAAIAVQLGYAQEDQIVLNGSFEEGFKGWDQYVNAAASASFSLEKGGIDSRMALSPVGRLSIAWGKAKAGW